MYFFNPTFQEDFSDHIVSLSPRSSLIPHFVVHLDFLAIQAQDCTPAYLHPSVLRRKSVKLQNAHIRLERVRIIDRFISAHQSATLDFKLKVRYRDLQSFETINKMDSKRKINEGGSVDQDEVDRAAKRRKLPVVSYAYFLVAIWKVVESEVERMIVRCLNKCLYQT